MRFKGIVLLLAVSPLCLAADIAPTRTAPTALKLQKEQNLEVSAGYLLNNSKSTDGSSTSKQNLTGNVLLQRMSGMWGQEYRLEAVNTTDDSAGSSNIERYLASGKLLRHQTDSAYQFAKLQWEKDLSSSFDYQASLTGGLGYDFLRDDVQSLTGELGAGYRHSKERQAPQDSHNELIGTLGVFYEREITSSLNFQQDLGYEYGEEAQVFRSRSALSVAVSKNFSAQASYQVKQTSADQGNSRDSLLSLGVKFKQ